jgi:hypothetical protein
MQRVSNIQQDKYVDRIPTSERLAPVARRSRQRRKRSQGLTTGEDLGGLGGVLRGDRDRGGGGGRRRRGDSLGGRGGLGLDVDVHGLGLGHSLGGGGHGVREERRAGWRSELLGEALDQAARPGQGERLEIRGGVNSVTAGRRNS